MCSSVTEGCKSRQWIYSSVDKLPLTFWVFEPEMKSSMNNKYILLILISILDSSIESLFIFSFCPAPPLKKDLCAFLKGKNLNSTIIFFFLFPQAIFLFMYHCVSMVSGCAYNAQTVAEGAPGSPCTPVSQWWPMYQYNVRVVNYNPRMGR